MAIPFHDRRTGQVLYHGTNAELSPGDVIRPAIDIFKTRGGARMTTPNSFGHWYAHASTVSGVADEYARMAAEAGGGKPRVYVVSPLDHEDVQEGHGHSVTSMFGFKVEKEVPHDPTQAVYRIRGDKAAYRPENYGK